MKKRPNRYSHLYSVENVLQSLLQNGKSALAQGFTRFRLEKEWPKIVGESISKNTLPCALEKGVLFVWVSHPTWMQQLVYFKDVIKEKVNSHLGYPSVYEVKFTLSKRASQAPSPSGEGYGKGSGEPDQSI